MSNVLNEYEFDEFAKEFAYLVTDLFKEFPDVLASLAGKALDNLDSVSP